MSEIKKVSGVIVSHGQVANELLATFEAVVENLSNITATAALEARALVPAVADYLVYAHRAAEPGHRLLLIHLQANPLLDMELRSAEGVGALLAWPLLQAAQQLLQR